MATLKFRPTASFKRSKPRTPMMSRMTRSYVLLFSKAAACSYWVALSNVQFSQAPLISSSRTLSTSGSSSTARILFPSKSEPLMLLLLSTGCLKGRDSNRKTCSSLLTTFDADFASHGFHEEFDPPETEPCSLEVAPVPILQPDEPFENRVLSFRGNPAAVILHGDRKVFVAGN